MTSIKPLMCARTLLLAALLFATACTGAPAPAAAPAPPAAPAVLWDADAAGGRVALRESVVWQPYFVRGGTAAALRAELDSKGPYSPADGRRFDSLATWGLRWSFRYERDAEGCRLAAATVELQVVVEVPELVQPDGSQLPDDLLTAWRSYSEALAAHETGHVYAYRAGARALQAALEAAPPAADCRSLGLALNALGEAQVEALRAYDRDYDAVTQHGRLQGAVFP